MSVMLLQAFLNVYSIPISPVCNASLLGVSFNERDETETSSCCLSSVLLLKGHCHCLALSVAVSQEPESGCLALMAGVQNSWCFG